MNAIDPIDELPGAPPVSVSQARAEVQQWLRDRIPLHGLHQIAIALDREVERLRAIEAVVRNSYECLKLVGAQYSPQGTRLAEVLKIKHEPQEEEADGA